MKEIDENEYEKLRTVTKFLGRVHPHSEKNVIYYYRADDGAALPTRYEILAFLSRSHADMDDTFDVICHWDSPEIVAVKFPKGEECENEKAQG